MNRNMKKIRLLILLLAFAFTVSGCRRLGPFYFSTSLSESYLAVTEHADLTAHEFSLIFYHYQNRYNHFYGDSGMEDFWNYDVSGSTFADYLKENHVREEICTLVLLNDMAYERKLELSEKELETCKEAAAEYWNSLSEIEVSRMGIDYEDVVSLYRKLRLSQNVIADITDGIYLEISDNDKRVITIQVICVDSSELAGQIKELLEEGKDFLTLAREYTTLSKIEYQAARGALNPLLEEEAFYLNDGETSDIIRVEDSWFLIKCIEDYDEELSKKNEKTVYQMGLFEQWSPVFLDYAGEHSIGFDETIWNRFSFTQDENMKNDSLYTVYNKWFPG